MPNPNRCLRRGHRAFRHGRIENAIAAFDAAVESAPTDRRGLIQSALARLRTGDYPAARAAADVLAERFPDDPIAALFAGRILLECGDPKAAEPFLRRAVQAQPDNELAQQYLALCKLAQGNVAEAAAEMNHLGFAANADFLALFSHEVERRLVPAPPVSDAESPPPSAAVVTALQEQESRAAALPASWTGRLRRRRIVAHLLRAGERAYDNGRFPDAMAIFEAASRLDPQSDFALLGVGLCALQMNRPNQAAEFLSLACRLRPHDSSLASHYADALYRAGQPEAALAVYEQIAPAGPDDFHAHYGCGRSLTALGRKQDAIEKFRTAFQCYRLDALDDCLVPAWNELKAKVAAANAPKSANGGLHPPP
ncbi:MAG: tetratricopeptide repeat protein [Candidatus Sumerlaeia bacterium]|nr:tetratricopeptide repeat protein [Candidatus Sumerlaeia bacterium]